MTINLSEEKIYEQAKKRVEERRGFFIHFSVYIVVNITLIFIWMFASNGRFPWFIFPLAGWSIAILLHYIGVFGSGSEFKSSAIEKEADKIRAEQG